MESLKRYSLGEEIANAVTHGIGAALSVVGLVYLVYKAAATGGAREITAVTVYGISLILLFTFSTLYHSLTPPRAKKVFRVFDHAAIYLLISGTYTPFLLICFDGFFGWSVFIGIWTLSISGILFEIFFIGRFRKFSTFLYILLGWISIFLIRKLLQVVPGEGIFWLGVGGAFYTLGVVFYAWRKLPYSHFIWHLFVLSGAVAHYIAITEYLLPG